MNKLSSVRLSHGPSGELGPKRGRERMLKGGRTGDRRLTEQSGIRYKRGEYPQGHSAESVLNSTPNNI